MEFSAQQIAGFLNGTIEGDPNVKVSNFSKIEEGKPGTLTFLANLKYAHHIYNTEASIVLVNNDFKPEQHKSHTCKSRERLCGARDVIKFGRAIEEQKEGG